MFSRKRSIPFSKYIEIIRPNYIYLKITPDKSIINEQNTNVVTRAIKSTYKTIFHKIKIEKKKLWFETDFKISYIVDMNKDGASFIFMIPELYYDTLFEKICSIWERCTFEKIDGIDGFSKNAKCYGISYKKEDALCLNVEAKNIFLGQLLSNIKMLEDNDRVTIIYNFLPCSEFNWLGRYDSTMKKIYQNQSVLKDKFNFESIFLGTIDIIQQIVQGFVDGINSFLGENKSLQNVEIINLFKKAFNLEFNPSYYTRQKREEGIINTQIVYFIDGKDKTRNEMNALSTKGSFKCLDGDNSLISKVVNVNRKFDIETYRFPKVETLAMSVSECNALVQLPTRQQSEINEIEYIDVTQERVPEKLTHGYFKLGVVECQGEQQVAYLEDEYNVGNLPLVIDGTQGSGKTTFMAHIYKYANTRNEGGVVIDFIKNNEMSEDIISFVPKDRLVILDYSDENCMQSFAFNELNFNNCSSAFKKRQLISQQAERVLDFVDAVNPNKPLEPRMRKYLSAASNVVFATGECTLKEVVHCLQSPEARSDYISKVYETDLAQYLETKISELGELTDKNGGNKDDRVNGILDRISLLREDFKLEYMFDKDVKDNINFTEELEKGKLIIIKMPQAEFSDHARDVITTFFISKIWLAVELRGSLHKQPNRIIVSIDEIAKTPTAYRILTEKNIIPQTRKFGCKFVFTCQSFNQIFKLIGSCIESGASFMLLKGTKVQDFNMLRSRAENFDYSDIDNMELFYSLNIINYSDGYASFITKLPYEKEEN